jgi:hypothetical protein
VYWIEDRPTPDGGSFLLGANSRAIDGAIWEPYFDENRKAARNGVLFAGGPDFPANSEEVAALGKQEVTVKLTKDGQPVSNAVPLHRIRTRGVRRVGGGPLVPESGSTPGSSGDAIRNTW